MLNKEAIHRTALTVYKKRNGVFAAAAATTVVVIIILVKSVGILLSHKQFNALIQWME